MINIIINNKKKNEIRQLASLRYTVGNLDNLLPANFNPNDFVNMIRQDGYIQGYNDALITVLNDVYKRLGKDKTVKFLKEYIEL